MTTQSAISAQSFGTSTNIGDNKFSINPLTLAATTTAYVVNVQVTNGSTGDASGPRASEVVVYYTTTMRTVTAAAAPSKLGQTARFVAIRLPVGASVIAIKDSTLEPVTGSLFHCWVSAPTLAIAASLSVDIVELP